MPFKIVRNDITKMETDAIVNTANRNVAVGAGCDLAIYQAAGYDKLLAAREEIGVLEEGEAAITPGFDLTAKYIIHAVSPMYIENGDAEEKLRACYRNSLMLAKENEIESIAFPLIATGSFGYPREEGMRIALDEINGFLLNNEMMVYLVVFDSKSTMLGEKVYPALEAYIDHHYVCDKRDEEYGDRYFGSVRPDSIGYDAYRRESIEMERRLMNVPAASAPNLSGAGAMPESASDRFSLGKLLGVARHKGKDKSVDMQMECSQPMPSIDEDDLIDELQSKLSERMEHLSDTFSQYLIYLIESKGMSNAEVYNRAIVDKKVFSKIKNNPDYHPKKITALCLCVGAKLNMDEAKDLLARAGYALSPCDKQDIIFSYFIENEIYDMIELDIQLEEHGLSPIIE